MLIENGLERYNYGNCDDIGHVNKFHANKKSCKNNVIGFIGGGRGA